MDYTRIEASVDTHATAFDTLARSLHGRLPRRRVAGLLAATLASGMFVLGISSRDETAEAKRKRGKHKRGSSRGGGLDAARATSIPPNCIYVCCDGTCDSWKMCLKCVKWPKPTTTTTVATG